MNCLDWKSLGDKEHVTNLIMRYVPTWYGLVWSCMVWPDLVWSGLVLYTLV
jgi:hypothetical protein